MDALYAARTSTVTVAPRRAAPCTSAPSKRVFFLVGEALSGSHGSGARSATILRTSSRSAAAVPRLMVDAEADRARFKAAPSASTTELSATVAPCTRSASVRAFVFKKRPFAAPPIRAYSLLRSPPAV